MTISRPMSRIWPNTAGNAATEFALILPVVLILLLAVYDLGTGFITKINVQSALNSGMQHVMQTDGSDTAMTRTVINHQLGDKAAAATVALEKICRCSTLTIACNTSCPTGAEQYVLASATLPYTSPLMGIDMSIAANFELFIGYR